MAMERPNARIVLVDLEHHVRGCVFVFCGLHPHGVAALGVGRVGDGVVPFAEAFCKDVARGERLARKVEKKGRKRETYMLWPCMCMGWPPKEK
jgi:hypothetical protein